MRSKFLYHLIILQLSLAIIFTAWPWPAAAQNPTAFTYQGRLQHGDDFVDGVSCSFDFLLYDAAGGGSQLGPVVSKTGVPVTDGYFSVTLDFGAVFTQTIRYLQINNLNCGNPGDPVNLGSRVPLRSAPYAQYANTAGSAAQVSWTNIISKPAGFADDTDDGKVIECENGQTLRWDGTNWACANILNDHGGLNNLNNDDHTQYFRADGARAMTGPLDLDDHRLANVTPGITDGQAVTYEQAVKVGDPAGGDLVGVYPNPTVVRIHTYPVTSTLPTNGWVFTWNGSQWAPALGQTGGPAGGDLDGDYPNPTVIRLQGRDITSATPQDKQVLSWNGSQWTLTAAIDANESASGDLSGAYPDPRVARLQGRPVANTAPDTGDLLIWNGSQWMPTAAGASGAAGGDLTGNYPGPTVAGLLGYPIAATTPATNQFFAWDGSQWTPAAVTQLQGREVAATTPGNLQVLVWNGAAWTPTTVLKSGDAAGGDLTGAYPNPQVDSNEITERHVNIPIGSSASTDIALTDGGGDLYLMPASFTPSNTGACLVIVSAHIRSEGSAVGNPCPILKTAKRVGGGANASDTSTGVSFSPADADSGSSTVIASASYIWELATSDVGQTVSFGCHITDPDGDDWGTDEYATCQVSYLCQ